MARPKLDIDGEEVRKLAALHCTTAEIAAFYDCSRDTIEGRFSAELNKGRQQGKMQLRDWQLQCARKGNVAMLIFLGKQYLKQSDSPIEPDAAKSPENSKADTINLLVNMLADKKE